MTVDLSAGYRRRYGADGLGHCGHCSPDWERDEFHRRPCSSDLPRPARHLRRYVQDRRDHQRGHARVVRAREQFKTLHCVARSVEDHGHCAASRPRSSERSVQVTVRGILNFDQPRWRRGSCGLEECDDARSACGRANRHICGAKHHQLPRGRVGVVEGGHILNFSTLTRGCI